MLRSRSSFSTVLTAIALSLSVLGHPVYADDVKIAAAANLQKVLTDALIPAFKAKTGNTVTPTFGSTKLLAAQLENGAPVDVFVAADTPTVTGLATKGLLDGSTERVYAI